jgi:hypothetical protein
MTEPSGKAAGWSPSRVSVTKWSNGIAVSMVPSLSKTRLTNDVEEVQK